MIAKPNIRGSKNGTFEGTGSICRIYTGLEHTGIKTNNHALRNLLLRGIYYLKSFGSDIWIRRIT